MLSQKELLGCEVKYVHALVWVPEEKLISYRAADSAHSLNKETGPQSNWYQLK